jgi:hypothetical protein
MRLRPLSSQRFLTCLLKELFMKSLVPSSPRRAAAQAGLVLAFVLGQMPVHAAKPDAAPAPDGDMAPVVVSSDPVKLKHKHRKISRAPAKPEALASKPQQPVRALR